MKYYKENREILDRFINYISIDRSKNTVKNYERSLKIYEEFLMLNEAQLIGVNRAGADGFVQYMIGLDLQPSTISNRLVAIKGLYDYLIDYGILQSNPFNSVRKPKIPKRLPTPLKKDEIKALFEAIDEEDDIFLRQRDRLMVTTFIYTGIRLEEASGLRKANLNNRTLRIIGKGNKERQIYLPDAVMVELAKLEEIERVDDYWFVKKDGVKLTRRGIQARIKTLMLRAGIEDKSVHNLRHTGATLMLDAGADIRAVQDILGHESISTTEGYTKVTISNKKRVAGLLDSINLED